MRASLSVFVLVLGVASAACGKGEVVGGNQDVGGGGTGADPGTHPGEGGELAACTDKLTGDCGACMEGACCQQLAACAGDEGCWSCVSDAEAGCAVGSTSHDLAVLYWACELQDCKEECRPTPEPGECEGVFPGPCGSCLADSCCDTVNACNGNETCVECAAGNDEACDKDPVGFALAQDVWQCAHSSCEEACYQTTDPDPDPDPTDPGPDVEPACILPISLPGSGTCVVTGPGTIYECNPVNGAGCDTFSGSTCDRNPAIDKYVCYQGPNTANLCEACGPSAGEYCSTGLTCANAQCVRYCCSDFDCGAWGRCDKSNPLAPSDVTGLCVQK